MISSCRMLAPSTTDTTVKSSPSRLDESSCHSCASFVITKGSKSDLVFGKSTSMIRNVYLDIEQ